MSELLSQLQQLGDGEIDDLSIAHDASEEIVALRLRVAELVEALEALLEVRVIEADASYGLSCAKAEQALAAHCKQEPSHDNQ